MELVGPPQGWVECGWGVMRGEAGLSQNQITQDPQSRLRGLDFILRVPGRHEGFLAGEQWGQN